MKKSTEYFETKRKQVLEHLKPLLEDFIGLEPTDYEYITNGIGEDYAVKEELLRIKDVKINCKWNSIDAVLQEALGWVIVNYFTKGLGAFENQAMVEIKRTWLKWKQ